MTTKSDNNAILKTLRTPQEAIRQGEDNELIIQKALARHNNNFTHLLNGRDERRIVRKNLVGELNQGFEHRRHSLNMILESRLHSIREACNHILVTGKTHLRQQRLEYFGQVFRQVEQRMNALADEFLRDMDSRFSSLEKYSSEIIRKREQQRLEKSVDDFLNTLDSLMEEFRNIIHENINVQATLQEKEETTYDDEDSDSSDPIMDMFMMGGNAKPK